MNDDDLPEQPVNWFKVKTITFILIVTGVLSNLFLIKMVVLKSLFDKYCRFGIGIISISVICYLVSYGSATAICIATGSILKNSYCIEYYTSANIMDFVYCMSAMVFFTTHVAFSIERIISIKYPSYHYSKQFSQVFLIGVAFIFAFSLVMACFHKSGNQNLDTIYGLTTQLLVISNIPLMILAKIYSRKMYQADVTTYNLARKHQLFNAYEITRSFVFAMIVDLIIQCFVFLLQYMFYVGHAFFDSEQIPEMDAIIQILCPMSQVNTSAMSSFDGKRIVKNPTQNDCFEQMKATWAQEKF